MEGKNSKSDSYIVREAENIIEKYLKKRDLRDIQNYYILQEKYEKLKIISIALFATSSIGIILSFIIK